MNRDRGGCAEEGKCLRLMGVFGGGGREEVAVMKLLVSQKTEDCNSAQPVK